MSLLDKRLDDRCTPLDPLLEVLRMLHIAVLPIDDIFGILLQLDTTPLLELLTRKLREVRSDVVVTQTVEDDTIGIGITLSKLNQDIFLVLAHLRIRGVEHTVVVGLNLADGHQRAVGTIDDRLPFGVLIEDNTAVEEDMTTGKDVERTVNAHTALVALVDEVAHHIVLARTYRTLELTHIGRILTIVKRLAHNRLHIDNDVGNADRVHLLGVVGDRVERAHTLEVSLAIDPHIDRLLRSGLLSRRRAAAKREDHRHDCCKLHKNILVHNDLLYLYYI